MMAINETIGNFTSNLKINIQSHRHIKKSYKQGMTISGRAVYLLKHKGYSNIFILKNGYDTGKGKVKKGY